jgi:UDP-N-acetylglucosamine--N-acetylmuramyl-(pentapeptide) pyrophosphoryl-undecaprenol N-acetylglucosamine transferase
MKLKRIYFASGGTGGHLYPAIAVAEQLNKLRPEWALTFIGRQSSYEYDKIQDTSYNFFGITARGWSRSHRLQNILVFFANGMGIIKIFFYMLFNRPHAVFGTGGYVSAPTILAARLLRVPVCLQEQNTVPGLVTRWASLIAKIIFISYETTEEHLKRFKDKIQVLGTPIRDISVKPKPELKKKYDLDINKPVLLVFGGSQGSRTLNTWMNECMRELLEKTGTQIIWQTGFSEWQLVHIRNNLPEGVRIIPYLDPIYDYLGMADLTLCRAGASTLAEITAFGLPGLLVPYPHSTDNHQEKNALFIEEKGAGLCLLEKETTSKKLVTIVTELLADQKRLEIMGQNSKKLGKPEAAQNIARELIRMVEQNG